MYFGCTKCPFKIFTVYFRKTSVVTLEDWNIDWGSHSRKLHGKSCHWLTYDVRISFSAYLICGKVGDAVLQSGCRMWCTQSVATDTTAVASSAPETAVRNSSDLAGEKVYCMRRGDCRWWTMSNRTRNWSSAWSWVTRQSERPDWSAPGPATSTCHCRNSWQLTCPRSGLSTSIGSTKM